MYLYISNDMFVQTTFEAICGIHETHPDIYIYITWIDNVGIGFNKTWLMSMSNLKWVLLLFKVKILLEIIFLIL
jgi:hypothetical protein